MPKFHGFAIRSTKGDTLLSVSGNVSRSVHGVSQETQVLFPGEQIPENALLYLRLEDFKLIRGGRTYRFLHKIDHVALILPGKGGEEVRLDKKSGEIIRDMEDQWKVIQECNMIERPSPASRTPPVSERQPTDAKDMSVNGHSDS